VFLTSVSLRAKYQNLARIFKTILAFDLKTPSVQYHYRHVTKRTESNLNYLSDSAIVEITIEIIYGKDMEYSKIFLEVFHSIR
jgi:hypothetical protein